MMLGLLAWPTMADKQKSSEVPGLAFLEFLAEMEEVDGKLVSASDLLELNPPSTAGKKLEPVTEEQLAILKLLNSEGTLVEELDNPATNSGQATKNSRQTEKEEDKQ